MYQHTGGPTYSNAADGQTKIYRATWQVNPAWNTVGKLGLLHTVHPSRLGWVVNGFGQERRWALRLENETARHAMVDIIYMT